MAGFRVSVVALVKGPNIPIKHRVNERLFFVFELVVMQQTVELSDMGIHSKSNYSQQETKVVFRYPIRFLPLLWNVVAINVVIFPEHFFAVHFIKGKGTSAFSYFVLICLC